jgi:hypothetical protein
MTTKEDMEAFYAVEDAIRNAGLYVHRDDFDDEPPIRKKPRKAHEPFNGESLHSSYFQEFAIDEGVMHQIEEHIGGGRLGKSIVREALGRHERREWQALCRPQDRLSF